MQEAKKDSKKMEAAAVSTASLSDLKVAIESLGIAVSEEETVKKIRKELDEYDEDVRELDEVKNLVSRLDLRESMAAKLLFGRVNKILRRTDNLVAKLQKRQEKIHEKIQAMEPEDHQTDEHKEQIVTIQEIIEAVNKLQKSHNQDKVDQIAQVNFSFFFISYFKKLIIFSILLMKGVHNLYKHPLAFKTVFQIMP